MKVTRIGLDGTSWAHTGASDVGEAYRHGSVFTAIYQPLHHVVGIEIY